jgi:selenocysteine lyase/cysteine desulfurase
MISQVLAQEFAISSRAGLHCAPTAHRHFGTYDRGGAVRFSVSWFTEAWMLDAAAAAVRQVQQHLH